MMDPCPDFATEGSTDKICEALQEGNLWTELGTSLEEEKGGGLCVR